MQYDKDSKRIAVANQLIEKVRKLDGVKDVQGHMMEDIQSGEMSHQVNIQIKQFEDEAFMEEDAETILADITQDDEIKDTITLKIQTDPIKK